MCSRIAYSVWSISPNITVFNTTNLRTINMNRVEALSKRRLSKISSVVSSITTPIWRASDLIMLSRGELFRNFLKTPYKISFTCIVRTYDWAIFFRYVLCQGICISSNPVRRCIYSRRICISQITWSPFITMFIADKKY